MKTSRIETLVYCALFAALTAVFAQIVIPIQPVPISLATFAVMMCGLLLGWKYGALAVIVYILLGLVGVPVFAGFKNGAAALAGPTAGYIIGYIPYALLAGLAFPRFEKNFRGRCLLLAAGAVILYLLGTAWFMIQSGRGLWDSLSLCVLPFLPGDAAKIVLAALLAPRLRKAWAAAA